MQSSAKIIEVISAYIIFSIIRNKVFIEVYKYNQYYLYVKCIILNMG